MKMFNYLLLVTLMVCGSVLCEEEDINTAAMMTLLSRRVDRTALGLVSLERRMQSQFEELKTMIGNIGSAKQDESIKKDMESHLIPLIESSIRAQTLTVYSTLTTGKKALRLMKKNIETQVAEVTSQTENDIGTLQHYLKEYLENVDRQLTVTETKDKTLQTDLENTAREIARINDTCKSNFNTALSSTRTLQTDLENTAREMARINDACKSNFNTALSSTSSLQNKVSNLETELLYMKSKITKNSNSVSSITDMSDHTSFSTRLLTKLPNHPKSTKIVFDTINRNNGNNYDATTGVFTAPLSGDYLFLFNVEAYNEHVACFVLMVDGQVMAQAYANGKGSRDQSTGNSAIVLKHVTRKTVIPYGHIGQVSMVLCYTRNSVYK